MRTAPRTSVPVVTSRRLSRSKRVRVALALGGAIAPITAFVLVSTLRDDATLRDDDPPAYQARFAGGDSSANIPLDRAERWVMLRHVTGRSGELVRLYVHVKVEGSAACRLGGRDGYASGTTGRWLVTTHPVAADGTPDMGRELARDELVPCRTHADESLALDQRLPVRAGQELATVFRNIDPEPTRNWASLNFLYRRGGILGANGRNERSSDAPDSHYGLDPRETVGYSTDAGRSWAIPGGPYGAADDTTSFLPTYIHEFADGSREGQPYYSSVALSGAVTMVYPNRPRESISALGAYTSGPGAASVRLLVDGQERAEARLSGEGMLCDEIEPVDVPRGATVVVRTVAGPGGLAVRGLYADAVWARLVGHGEDHPHYLERSPQRSAPVYPLSAPRGPQLGRTHCPTNTAGKTLGWVPQGVSGRSGLCWVLRRPRRLQRELHKGDRVDGKSPPVAGLLTNDLGPEAARQGLPPLERLHVTGAVAGAAVVGLLAGRQQAGAALVALAALAGSQALIGRREHPASVLPLMRWIVAMRAPVYGVLALVLLDLLTGALGVAPWGFGLVLAVTTAGSATPSALRRFGRAPAPQRIAVIGAAEDALGLSRELRAGGISSEYVVVGVIDPRAGGEDGLGSLDDLCAAVRRNRIDLLVRSVGASREDVLEQIASCVDLPVRFCDLSGFCERVFGHVPVSEIDASWFQYIMHPRFRTATPTSKRALDVVVALAAGVAFAPLIAILGVLVRRDGGPALIRQTRIGEGGQPFTLYKLRSMRPGSERAAQWSSAEDPRITPLGRFLRRSHLDEIPQVLNVLKGEMSIVGPRPEQPGYVRRLEGVVPYYSRRHLVKPGITGWAQVRCGYAGSEIGSGWKMCHDLYYVKHRSIGLDLLIIAETVRTFIVDRQHAVEPEALPAFAQVRALRAESTIAA